MSVCLRSAWMRMAVKKNGFAAIANGTSKDCNRKMEGKVRVASFGQYRWNQPSMPSKFQQILRIIGKTCEATSLTEAEAEKGF
jgi:hypothetical protein